MKKEKNINYVLGILSVILVASLGSVFTSSGMSWFEGLNKPSEWIPKAIIPIIWSIIYLLFIVYIIFLIRKEKLNKKNTSLLIINGMLNVLWCLVFFSLHGLFLGQIVICLNLVASILLVINVKEILFRYILLIYPSWILIATYLNLACWILN